MSLSFQFPLFEYFGRYIINVNLIFLAEKIEINRNTKIFMCQKKKKVMAWRPFLCMETLVSNLIKKKKHLVFCSLTNLQKLFPH